MPLDPQVQAMRDRRARDQAPQLYTLTLAEARAEDLASIRAAGGDPEPVAEVLDMDIPGPDGPLPIRVYRGRVDGTARAGVLVYFFGGGWTLGSIDTSDGICRTLANAAACTVITVGYRLAPEAKFPAAVHDCHAATQWIAANRTELGLGADEPIVVGGDSAGGNLAAAVTLLARDSGGPTLAGQLLIYPNTLFKSDTPSMREGTDPYLFNRTSVAWYWGHYLATPADGDSPLASPLRAASHADLPPALVITAEHDPLRDEGEEYAQRLTAAGVPVVATRYDGMVHGFFAMAATLDGGKHALDQAATHLRAWLTPPA